MTVGNFRVKDTVVKITPKLRSEVAVKLFRVRLGHAIALKLCFPTLRYNRSWRMFYDKCEPSCNLVALVRCRLRASLQKHHALFTHLHFSIKHFSSLLLFHNSPQFTLSCAAVKRRHLEEKTSGAAFNVKQLLWAKLAALQPWIAQIWTGDLRRYVGPWARVAWPRPSSSLGIGRRVEGEGGGLRIDEGRNN